MLDVMLLIWCIGCSMTFGHITREYEYKWDSTFWLLMFFSLLAWPFVLGYFTHRDIERPFKER